MPQLNPLWWISLISWTFVILSFLVIFHQSISFPLILRTQLSRFILLFI